MEIVIEEGAISVCEEVRGACEILGLDPLYVANEGRFVAFVAPAHAERALAIMRSHSLGAQASLIGSVGDKREQRVTLISKIGVTRMIDMLSGEQLPRIC
jgi:hydrogenase expression/formation protein HypE